MSLSEIDGSCHSLLALIARANHDLVQAVDDAKSPKDIEDSIAKGISTTRLLCHKVNTAPALLKLGYVSWGIKLDELGRMEADLPIIEGWISWYKHQRNQQLGPIREIEAFLPVNPDFEAFKVKYKRRDRSINVKCNFIPPGTQYRLRQAVEYARALCNIFCARSPPPALGEPLPSNLAIIDVEENPNPRTPIASSFIDENKTFGQNLERIVKHFVNTAITTGATSDLLLPITHDDPEIFLPDDHPIRLSLQSLKKASPPSTQTNSTQLDSQVTFKGVHRVTYFHVKSPHRTVSSLFQDTV